MSAKQKKKAKEQNAKLAKTLDPFIKEIEAQNATLVFKGGDFYIATEIRLTEEIAELYGTVNGYPGRPGVTQIQRTEGLEAEMKKVEEKMKEFTGEKLNKVNNALAAAKLEPLKVITEEEFRKESKNGTSAGTQQQFRKLKPYFSLLF